MARPARADNPAHPTTRRGAGSAAVEDTMFRALGILRAVLTVNMVAVFVWHRDAAKHADAGYATLAALAVWTLAVSVAYERRAAWRGPLIAIDVLVALGALLITPYVKGAGFDTTVPGFWVMGPMLAAATRWGWRGGLGAAVLISTMDLSLRTHISVQNYGNIFLLMVGGPIVGFLAGLLQHLAEQRDRAERAAAAATERELIARVVHDGVLQVLALVQRRGAELGGEAARLGLLAAEQEVALRTFVQHRAATASGPGDPTGDLDLCEELRRLQTPTVSMALPAERFPLPAGVARETVALVAAALSNVRHHVGREAAAWVLLEQRADDWVLSVRDEGPGIPPGRLEQAAAEGRLGVADSIQGRAESLGGRVTLRTAPGEGTEWEFCFPTSPARVGR